MTDWSELTRIPLKARLYERETWFRDGALDAAELFGEKMTAVLRRAALVLIKPDGLVSGRASSIVRYLQSHGYSIAAVETPVLTRFIWRELWRFQLTSATPDRLAVNDLVLRGPMLLLMLRGPEGLDIPATTHLSGLKGPSDLASQSPDSLRSLLQQPNRIFSFIHIADEPADVLREVAIILEPPVRRRVLAALEETSLAAADQAVLDDVLAASDRISRRLDAQESLQRVDEALRSRNDAGSHERIAADLERMRRGERIEWRPFAAAVAAAELALDPWDLATLAATFIVYDEPGHAKQIPRIDPELWRRDAQPS